MEIFITAICGEWWVIAGLLIALLVWGIIDRIITTARINKQCEEIKGLDREYSDDEINNMFNDCISLTSVPSFDTKNVSDISNMFNGYPSLKSVPLFDEKHNESN